MAAEIIERQQADFKAAAAAQTALVKGAKARSARLTAASSKAERYGKNPMPSRVFRAVAVPALVALGAFVGLFSKRGREALHGAAIGLMRSGRTKAREAAELTPQVNEDVAAARTANVNLYQAQTDAALAQQDAIAARPAPVALPTQGLEHNLPPISGS